LRLWPRGGLWRHPDFLRLWGAQTTSQFGSQITLLALPLAAIISLEASVFEVAVLGALEYAPFLLLTLPAGVWVDRVRRRPLLIAADVARALVIASVPVAWAFDVLTIWQLFVVGFAAGAFTVVFDVAYVPYVASLVSREQLIDANSKVEISRSAAQTAGPGIAGALVELVTAPFALVADAVSFAVSALLAWRIRAPEDAPGPEGSAEAASGRRELVEGLRYVFGHRYLRPIIACTALSNFFGSAIWGPLLLLYGVRVLELDAGTIGFVLAVANVGVVAGAFAAAPVARRLGPGPTIAASAVFFGPIVLLIPLAPRSAPVPFLIAALAVTGFGGVIYNVSIRTFVQSITPNRLLGRATSVTRTVVWGVIPLGTLLGGALATAIGIHGAIWVGAIGATFASVPVLLSRVRSLRELPPGEREPEPVAAPALEPAPLARTEQ
jgi:MFS family permease